MKIKLLIPLMVFILVVQGCYYDRADELYPNEGTCNTTNVTYASVASIISSNGCLGCHGPVPQGGLSLVTYAQVKAKVTDGRLLGSISHSSGYSPMPKGMPQMSACDISRIRAWINAGAPNN